MEEMVTTPISLQLAGAMTLLLTLQGLTRLILALLPVI